MYMDISYVCKPGKYIPAVVLWFWLLQNYSPCKIAIFHSFKLSSILFK
jgi:hypothetical protein